MVKPQKEEKHCLFFGSSGSIVQTETGLLVGLVLSLSHEDFVMV